MTFTVAKSDRNATPIPSPPDAPNLHTAPPSAADDTDAILRALADPQRRQMLQLVRSGELPAGQIATHFDLTQQAVSHHLHVLQRAGLVNQRREGTRHLYILRPEALDPVHVVLADLWPAALQRLKSAVEKNAEPRSQSEQP